MRKLELSSKKRNWESSMPDATDLQAVQAEFKAALCLAPAPAPTPAAATILRRRLLLLLLLR